MLHVPGVPLEVRFAWGARNNYAFTTTALTSKLWLIYEDNKGEWQAQAVADIGDPSKVTLPVDSAISADDRLLWVNTFMERHCRVATVSAFPLPDRGTAGPWKRSDRIYSGRAKYPITLSEL